MSQVFADREHGGRALARSLERYRGQKNAVILALPRGGVPVAAEIARRLDLPVDVLVTAKMRTPGQEELALGAAGQGAVEVRNEKLGRALRVHPTALQSLAEGARSEVDRREKAYRRQKDPLDLSGRTAMLVDDGVATGASMRAAIEAAGRLGAARIVVAVPVGASDTCDELREKVDELHCLLVPSFFRAVGEHYGDFAPVEDEQVRQLLASHG